MTSDQDRTLEEVSGAWASIEVSPPTHVDGRRMLCFYRRHPLDGGMIAATAILEADGALRDPRSGLRCAAPVNDQNSPGVSVTSTPTNERR